MEGLIDPLQLTIIGKLLLAAALGAFLGAERWRTGKAAGMRTYALVALGAALYTVISEFAFKTALPGASPDGLIDASSRVISQIVVGIGFLGAGLIIHHGTRVQGLTTAAGLWLIAGVGVTVGLGLYGLAIFATLLAFVIFWVVGHIERNLEAKR